MTYECHYTKQSNVGAVSSSMSVSDLSLLDVLIPARIAAVESAKFPSMGSS